MAEVTVISSTIVRPGNKDQPGREKIHLAPHDLHLLYLVYPQRGLLFPKPDPKTRFIPQLKAALSTALEIYFPFAGRLVKVDNHQDNTVSFYIDCDGSGAKFVHAKAESVSVDELLQSRGSVPHFMNLFFPANNVESRDALTSEILLALQVTEMKDGVFISFGYNHMVADGCSFWSFFHTWSNIFRTGSGHNSQPLALKDWSLDKIDYPVRIPVSEMERPQNCENPTKERVFHFSKKKISYLKEKANDETGSIDSKVSSLQALPSADMRRRLNPPLEKECFGNLAHLAVATTTVGEVLDHGLGWTALQISKSVRSQTNESYNAFAENWVRNVEVPKIGVGSRMADNSLIVASSPWFDVYGHDFGWGKPVAARAGPSNGVGGLLVMFRGVEEGSIDVHAILTSSLWSDALAIIKNPC
ncbi:unnamed protein product [Microthlaspi erraticum]|uniref:Acetyltransferase n=1 Tax=Microthlaspi erraticum TaxID=1685480 RepID=A0A6D2IM89_9BRAS|nr:unnamed protein product [Microthlaspi erraticum]